MSVQWQKSTFSGVEGENCIEVTRAEPYVFLRESDNPAAVLTLSPSGLLALICEVRAVL
ncbi:DUF397 domain-containing protein [Streptomyces sp. NPDC051677]|uniref:DUF397 domain-containing protein n=1 Tax=Streptomyces sp. NPDC051677 TaxID=3365669 RepID=UPI0037D12D35